MSTVTEVQALLRFLSQDAKVPVPLAMSKVKELQKATLTTPDLLAKSSLPNIQTIFTDEKTAKQILAAAKRATKKRTSSSAAGETAPSPSKRRRNSYNSPEHTLSPSQFEASLTLPSLDSPIADKELEEVTLYTNRAPLVVAFCVQLLKYTMPSQPLSARLSLAQAVMSTGAKSKAVHLGIQSGKTAEDEGWGEGQPVVRVMGRDVPVLRRWGYELNDTHAESEVAEVTAKVEDVEHGNSVAANADTQTTATLASQDTVKPETAEDPPPLWGLNLETLRSTHAPPPVSSSSATAAYTSSLPIHDPHSARSYLLKSFPSPSSPLANGTKKPPSKAAQSQQQEEKERNLALLLYALDLVFRSWIDVIGAREMDKRAWGWYVRVRPEVEAGQAGWGGKGEVRLGAVLALRR
ncbi:MAG: hypothetical protein LQ351_003127 [Letrouitia transgressa]|nr:MAG: hypothetical protein LQ351_003127 [Letrouitia transgressa]